LNNPESENVVVSYFSWVKQRIHDISEKEKSLVIQAAEDTVH
jgi:hypothetical protein